jgi:hypothetical protein
MSSSAGARDAATLGFVSADVSLANGGATWIWTQAVGRRSPMAHVVTDLDTTASPDQVIHALTDFSARRLELWPNIDRKYYKLAATGDTSADVTEGSNNFGGVWERAHYDWSRPGIVRIDVMDSNAFSPGSYWQYEVTTRPEGGSHVHMEFDRRPRNLKGWLLSAIFAVAGSKLGKQWLGETLHRIEANGSGPTS